MVIGLTMACWALVISMWMVRAHLAVKKRKKTMGTCPRRVPSAACTCDGTCTSSFSCTCGPCTTQLLSSLSFGGPVMGGGGAVRISGGISFTGGGGGAGSGISFTGGGGGGGGAGSVTSSGGNGKSAGKPRARTGYSGIAGFDGKSQDEFGLAVGYVRGVRQWNFPVHPALQSALGSGAEPSAELLVRGTGWQAGGPLLTGVAGGSWAPGVNEAKCLNYPEHAPPVEFDEALNSTCGCGYWAYWELAPSPWNNALPVMGVIRGTGRVLIGEKGFRCQKAEIIGLAPGFMIAPGWSGQVMDRYRSGSPWVTARADKERQDREMEQARQQAEAWMAIIMEALGALYPDARIFATVKGMLACLPPGEVTT